MRKLIVPMILAIVCSQAVFAADVAQILNETGIKDGIIVHIGCDDPGQLAKLRVGKACVVHGLDTDAVKVAKARAFLSARRVHGPVSASVYNGAKLPYIDNLVNLVIADELGSLSREEILRVLARRSAQHGLAGASSLNHGPGSLTNGRSTCTKPTTMPSPEILPSDRRATCSG